MEKEELVELLTLCIKEQNFHGDIPKGKAGIIVDILHLDIFKDHPMYIKEILNKMGKALIEASEHIK